MEEEAAAYPTGNVYVVSDNLNIHGGDRWAQFNARHGNRFHFVFTPQDASRVDQIEVGSRSSTAESSSTARSRTWTLSSSQVLGFIEWWNEQEAHPLRWTELPRFVLAV
jgi:hypothetical protein